MKATRLVTKQSDEDSLMKYCANKNIDSNLPRRPFKRQMSSLGRFSLRSETAENPSIMSFFLLLDGADVELEELNNLLKSRMLDKYERFNARICPENYSSFEVRKLPNFNYPCMKMKFQ
jgi:hypothetical protein